jgi:hypothetical protein
MSKPNLNVSIAGLTDIFQKAALPSTFQRSGFWRARFIGPWWLRISGMPSCYVSGLWGWQGKKFLTADSATNVLARGDSTIDALSMQARECPSALDGKPVVALTYGEAGPVPWRWVTDELRALDDRTLLGMTRIDLPLLRHMVFPFLLERE